MNAMPLEIFSYLYVYFLLPSKYYQYGSKILRQGEHVVQKFCAVMDLQKICNSLRSLYIEYEMTTW